MAAISRRRPRGLWCGRLVFFAFQEEAPEGIGRRRGVEPGDNFNCAGCLECLFLLGRFAGGESVAERNRGIVTNADLDVVLLYGGIQLGDEVGEVGVGVAEADGAAGPLDFETPAGPADLDGDGSDIVDA